MKIWEFGHRILQATTSGLSDDVPDRVIELTFMYQTEKIMASERSPAIDYAIISLLLVNVGISAYSVLRPSAKATEPEVSTRSKLEITESQAQAFAADFVALYNAKDDAGLYQKLDSLAKAQLTQEQLSDQLNKLYPLMGTVSDAAFSSSALAASEGGRDYFTLIYKVRLSGGPFGAGEMKLTVTPKENGLGLVGFFLNGTSQANRP